MHPACALLTTSDGRIELGDQMNVIWHDYRRRQVVPVAIEVQQRLQNDLGEFSLSEDAGPVA